WAGGKVASTSAWWSAAKRRVWLGGLSPVRIREHIGPQSSPQRPRTAYPAPPGTESAGPMSVLSVDEYISFALFSPNLDSMNHLQMGARSKLLGTMSSTPRTGLLHDFERGPH